MTSCAVDEATISALSSANGNVTASFIGVVLYYAGNAQKKQLCIHANELNNLIEYIHNRTKEVHRLQTVTVPCSYR